MCQLHLWNLDMKKIVLDPPLEKPIETAYTVFGNCQTGHSPLFAVCSDVAAHDALVHIFISKLCPVLNKVYTF